MEALLNDSLCADDVDVQIPADLGLGLELLLVPLPEWPPLERAIVWTHAAAVVFGLLSNAVARLALARERRTRLRATGALMSGVCEANLFALIASATTGLAPFWQWAFPAAVDEQLIGVLAQAAAALHSLANGNHLTKKPFAKQNFIGKSML